MQELTRDFPDKTYREKMAVVSERWKQTKITQLVRLNARELLDNPIDDTYMKRLKYTLIDVGSEEFLEMKIPDSDGKSLLLGILSRLFQSRPYNTPFFLQFKKFFGIREFYKETFEGLDILDLCCLHFRYDFLFLMLEAMPPRWKTDFILERRERLGCLMNVLLYNIFDEGTKYETLEILRDLLNKGLDPNLEIASPISDERPPYRDSLLQGAALESIPEEEIRKLVRYTGLHQPEAVEYRKYLRESDYAKNLETVILENKLSTVLLGDTIFSVYLQNSRNQRHRAYTAGIIRSGVLDTHTILHPYKYRNTEGVKTYLSISLLTGSLRHMDELSSLLFHLTPSFLFYISDLSPKNPTGNISPMTLAMKNIRTCWNGFIWTSPDSVQVIMKILTGGFCIPREEFFWKIHMQPEFVKYVREEIHRSYFRDPSKTVFENLLEADADPTQTCLSSLLLHPPVLKRVLAEGVTILKDRDFVLEQFREYRQIILKEIQLLCLPNAPGMEYTNETFLTGDERVGGSRKLIFRTEDNYAFETSEWPFLLGKKINPYTRRPLSEEECRRLRSLRLHMNSHWTIFSRDDIPFLNFLRREGEEELSLRDTYVTKIDEFLDSIDMVNYGTRLRDHVRKLENPHVLRNFYIYLFQNPSLCLLGHNLDTTFADWCMPLSHTTADPGDLEEILVYYNFRTKNISTENVQKSLENVLGHIYNILETLQEYGRRDRFVGRVISVYYLLDNYLSKL